MTYEEWANDYCAKLNPHAPLQDEDLRAAWNAAIEEAAKLVAEKYDELEPWLEPDEVRALKCGPF